MASIPELTTLIGQARMNPSLIQDEVYNAIDLATEGKYELVDPSTPMSIVMGSGVALFSAGVQEGESLHRRMYTVLSETDEEIYNHMSDFDYVGRFSTPADADFTMLMSKAEVLQRVVPVPGTTIKQLTIPRNTNFTVDGFTFSLQYPINIQLMPHGGLELSYDNSSPSPIYTLPSNLVDWNTQTIEGLEMLVIQVPTQQFKITSKTIPVAPGSTFTQKFTLEDQYYFCRIWGHKADGSWREYKTTHSEQVHDLKIPTVVLRVTGNQFSFRIPQIYFTAGLLDSEIRVDIYTTKGAINKDFSAFSPANFVTNWLDLENSDSNIYSAPFGSINQYGVVCSEKIIGGTNGLTTDELRERVIHNANYTDKPITDAQLSAELKLRGFDVLKSTDDITSRTYLATRNLPSPESGKFSTGIGCSIEMLQTNIAQLVGYKTVADNGERVTIKPTTLYQVADGSLRIVADTEVAAIRAMTGDNLVNQVNNNTYVYSPFHYVLDTTDNQLAARPYYMMNPRITRRFFIEENETMQLQVAPDTFNLEKTEAGYTLTVSTRSGEAYKALDDNQCYLQLGFKPEGENSYAFMNGRLLPNKVNGERVWQFDIQTNWDVNSKDYLQVTNFTLFSNVQRVLGMLMSGDWDLVYVVTDYDVYLMEARAMDVWKGNQILPANSFAVSRHRINVTVGDVLSGLWSNARPVTGSLTYAVWDNDILAYYEQDVFERDATGIKFTIVNGEIQYVILHHKGDPVIDQATGKQIIRFHKGTTKVDANGEPLVVLTRQLEQQIDLFQLDGTYFFATDPEDIEYATSVAQNVVDWLTGPIAYIRQRLFENTKLFFYPKRTLGYTRVIVEEGREISIPAGLQFHVTYHMSLTSYANNALRDSLATSASRIISTVLARKTVSTSDIINRLVAAAGTDVIGIKVDDFGPRGDISTYTAADESMRCAIKRKLTVLPEGILRVAEDLAFDYINHQLATVDQA